MSGTAGQSGPSAAGGGRLRIVLIVLEAALAVGGLYGGIAFIVRPNGEALGMSTDLLSHTPFDDYLVPGVLLLAANAVLPLAVAWAALRRWWWAPAGHLSVGLVLSAWIIVQLMLVGYATPIQPACLALGILILLLAWASRSRSGGGA
jgi:hypothetical protein